MGVSFRVGVLTQLVVETPAQLEMMPHVPPPTTGTCRLLYLMENLNDLLLSLCCQHMLLVGDLNDHLGQDAYENLLTV